MANDRNRRMDMCSGPLFSKIVFFTIPLMMTYILQLLFHAADLIVVGRCATGEALAAVGATNGLTTLVLNVFFGLSTGINVVVARSTGARNHLGASRGVHTAAAIALRGGIAMAVIGILISKPMLQWMETPPQILDKAVLYMRLFCAGIPFVVFFHFGSCLVRIDRHDAWAKRRDPCFSYWRRGSSMCCSTSFSYWSAKWTWAAWPSPP